MTRAPVTRDDDRAATWLRSRGWLTNVNRLWWHRDLAPGRDECTLAEAVRRQTRHDHAETARQAVDSTTGEAHNGATIESRRAVEAADGVGNADQERHHA